ncbi:MAG TPA: DUF1003 domain-containing protein [Fimbriimonadaceae bacterium]|nr:DUF1003 domain-containing protein [Fimbriimonadaceae bacterium]
MSIREILARHSKQRTASRLNLERATNPDVADVIEENICTIVELRRAEEKQKRIQDRVADAITAFSGSMSFLYLHAFWFVGWVVINLGWTPIHAFDPYPFNFLTMVVSLEAIFLSTFVLISQNKMGEVADKRADLDLQINLLAEYEITRILRLVDAMAIKMGIEEATDPEMQELKATVSPGQVLEEIKNRENQAKKL